MKKLTVLAGVFTLIIIAGAMIFKTSFNQGATATTVTTVSIIADYKMANTPNNDSILCDFIKVLKAECDHILVNPELWSSFIEQVAQCKVSFDPAAWQLFDTQLGLIYIRNAQATYTDGIRHEAFKRIDNPLDASAIATIANRNWTVDLDKIFNVPAWQEQHALPGCKCMVYMSGHGARRAQADEYSSIGCGILSIDLANVAQFFNDQLKIDTFAINSCYWTANRLHDELQTNGAAELSCTIISPLLTEEMLWLTADIGCSCDRCTRDCPSFFDTCRTFTGQHEAELTPGLCNILLSSDTVMDNIEKMQQPTIIMAGTNESVSIMA